MDDTLPFRADQLELSPFGYNQLQRCFDVSPWLEWDCKRRGLTREEYYWFLRDWGYTVRENKYFDQVSRSRRPGALRSEVINGKSFYVFDCVYQGDVREYFIDRKQDLVYRGRMAVEELVRVVRQSVRLTDTRASVTHGYEILYYLGRSSHFMYARCVAGPQYNELTRVIFSCPPESRRCKIVTTETMGDVLRSVELFALGTYVEVDNLDQTRKELYL